MSATSFYVYQGSVFADRIGFKRNAPEPINQKTRTLRSGYFDTPADRGDQFYAGSEEIV
jgi:hypothetical protein